MEAQIIPAARAGTLYGLLRERAVRTPEAPAYRQYERGADAWREITWAEALARADLFAGGLAAPSLAPGERVAILLQNCIDWVCFDMAAHKLGLPVVPLYTNDAVSNTAFLISDARPRVIFVESAAKWATIAAALDDVSFIEEVWVQQAPAAAAATGATEGPRVVGLEQVLERGAGIATEMRSAPDDAAVLIYTSGTTGVPKGAVLTHAAILRNAEGVAKVFPSREDDVFLSILPLAHGFERTMGYVLAMMGGACVAYAQSLLRLRQDLTRVRPTAIMGVPRFFESVYDSARRAAAKDPVRKTLFEMTGRIGWERFAARSGIGPGPGLRDRLLWPLLERVVARKLKATFGGRLRVAVSGGANFPPEISRALVGLGIPMVEGYGLTEAGPVVTASPCAQYLPGTVGFALPEIETRLTEAGELLVRTPGRMQGYWQKPAETAAILDPEGWLRTGDLAEIRDGRIRIAGRLKHILVLSNGENVNPLPIETALAADPLFEQVCVAGDGRPFLTLLMVLNRENWADLALGEGLDPARPNDPAAEKVLLPRIKGHLKGFAGYQQIRAYHASQEEWSVERRLLTPTLKLRRERVVAEFQSEIGAMYDRLAGRT